MEIAYCMVFGYLLGAINPAAIISAMKKKNLTKMGSGNLGATNTMLAFGKKYGVIVMIFDMLKSYLSVKITRALFPHIAIASLLAGVCAVIGHIFPFYMKFHGGKGLASFGGLFLAYDPALFVVLLVIGLLCVFVVNYGTALPISAAILAPFLTGLRHHSFKIFWILLQLSIIIIYKHLANLENIKNGTEIKVRDFLRKK